MGIPGLLQGLKSRSRPGHVTDYAGQCMAVDASSWLHKSVYSIADHYVETLERTGTIDARCIAVATKYVTTRCRQLLHANVRCIYLVFDGQRCPLKAGTNQDREARRQAQLQQARASNDTAAAYEAYKACIKVCDDLVQAVANQVRNIDKVRLVWSPYEADAQLMQLAFDGTVQAVVTEDSDVLVYSVATCVPVDVLFKLDRNTGHCTVLNMDFLLSPQAQPHVLPNTNNKKKKPSGLEPILQAFLTRPARHDRARLFVQACIVAGCDYAPNRLPGVGLVSAFRAVRSAMHAKPETRLARVLQLLPHKARQHVHVPEYQSLWNKSEAVFYYHPVRNEQGQTVYLGNAVPAANEHVPNLDRFEDLEFLGSLATSGTAAPPPPPAVACRPVSTTAPTAAVHIANKRPLQQPLRRPRNHSNDNGGDNDPVANIVAMANPYLKKKPTTKRHPLEPSSPNEPPPTKKTKPNPFASFAAKEKENQTKHNPFVVDEDVRFVKRTFPKDASRTTLRTDATTKVPTTAAAIKAPTAAAAAAIKPPSRQVQVAFDYGPIGDTPESIDLTEDDDQMDEPRRDPLPEPLPDPSCITTISKYFSTHRHPWNTARRVTEDVLVAAAPEPAAALEPAPAQSSMWQLGRPSKETPADAMAKPDDPSPFDFYSDFLSPKSFSDSEDIVESSPENQAAAVVMTIAQKPLGRAKNLLGKATKKLRFGFQGSSSQAVKKKPAPIARAFQRQRQLYQTATTARNVTRRAPLANKLPWKRSGRSTHFSAVTKDDPNTAT